MKLQRPLLVFAFAFIVHLAEAAIVKHTFHIGNLTVTRLCHTRTVIAVNKQTPGPTIEVNEGDTLVIEAINDTPYNLTLHWHGIFQRLSGWADGANMITQCPILPGNKYMYKFDVVGQEGTLWWHAHLSFLRETVHGALIIRPREGAEAYPFPRPYKEIPIILGEWWNDDVVTIDRQAFLTGGPTRNADAFTINGHPGNLYNCSSGDNYRLMVEAGKTYLVRIINAAVNNQLFFKIANHSFTVVAVDACYTNPYQTDLIVIAPGQTVDALMVADAPPAQYYMAALAYESANPPAPIFVNSTTRGIVEYISSKSTALPVMPDLPFFFDTPAAHHFFSNLTGLVRPSDPTVPLYVDKRLFVTIGLGFADCLPSQTLCNASQGQLSLAASMNNASFIFPSGLSLLEAYFRSVQGIYTTDFPDKPPIVFDFTNVSLNSDNALASLTKTVKGTRLISLKYNTKVEIVLQNTAIIGIESHPMHIHGHDFYILAQGFGNYDEAEAIKGFNLKNPLKRNTIAVPTGGWAVIRFTTTNPGIWFVHCHIDTHLRLGLATALVVENGPTPHDILPPPPPDFPKC
ncbi:hypothetical protein LUZ61_011414 [Rhynchospora tenuis]|uniref:Laccase n=1 Tax=Rhynchospora tenuis TaxID=198213 RepID=A0AAD6F099_9POAL|nr:hypothetical protein LUZ61_011414 [Rhynchospora tenuis]